MCRAPRNQPPGRHATGTATGTAWTGAIAWGCATGTTRTGAVACRRYGVLLRPATCRLVAALYRCCYYLAIANIAAQELIFQAVCGHTVCL
jgi:hypothetical protein